MVLLWENLLVRFCESFMRIVLLVERGLSIRVERRSHLVFIFFFHSEACMSRGDKSWADPRIWLYLLFYLFFLSITVLILSPILRSWTREFMFRTRKGSFPNKWYQICNRYNVSLDYKLNLHQQSINFTWFKCKTNKSLNFYLELLKEKYDIILYHTDYLCKISPKKGL